GLRPSELDYAVAGFEDMCQAMGYALMRAHALKQPPPSFDGVYAAWLASSIRLSHQVYPYRHHNEDWQVQILNNAYGRCGLMVRTVNNVACLHDAVYACPVEHMMGKLLQQVAERVSLAVG
ncbi:MAG: hypothetical protein H7Y11_09590, partial [Armatimonadetes bacterium]|nr:hypothetical protein [Anaerolineae bacterium]